MDSFMPIKRALSVTERVRVANTYVISMLRYPMQFQRAPKDIISRLRNRVEKWVSPLWRSLPLDLLATPTKSGGLRLPLIDMKLMNIAAIHDQGIRCGPDPFSMAEGMLDHLDWLSPRWNIKWSMDYIAKLTGSEELSDPAFSSTYARLVTSATEVGHWVRRRGLAGGSAETFLGNSISLKVIDAVKMFAWGLIANALPFAARTRWRLAVGGISMRTAVPSAARRV